MVAKDNQKKLTKKEQTDAVKKRENSDSNPNKNLIIVESPTKVKTIKGYVGNDYEVVATKGHIMELPKYSLGIDIKNGFDPKYEILSDKKALVKSLIESAKDKKAIYLASDNDREGEAIAFHVQKVLEDNIDKSISFHRIVFNEITNNAIISSLKAPRQIDIKKVDSQKARRVLDRLVGYQISPILWKKIMKGISAGRVQSVTLRYIVDRESERENFTPEKYWPISALVDDQYEFELKKVEGRSYDSKNEELKEKAEKILLNPDNSKIGKIISISSSSTSAKQLPPYITATLQQDAFRHFNYPPKKTMMIAQKLYEGIQLKSEHKGLITYMRTDSTRVSNLALEELKNYISENFGSKYYSFVPFSKSKTNDKNIQEAHEAIRPTDISLTPEKLKQYLGKDELNIYSIIWERYISAFMKPPVFRIVTIKMEYLNCIFEAKFRNILEKNSLEVLKILKPSEKIQNTPDFKENDQVTITKINIIEKFTEPPSRYDEASLIKKLKEEGIGRPSTYATIMGILYDRNYVVKEDKKLVPTDVGKIVVNFLVKYFPEIFDYKFTARMEDDLDRIEKGEADYIEILSLFYSKFEPLLNQTDKMESFKEHFIEKTNLTCEKCGSPMVVRKTKFGEFLACSNYPNCKNSKSFSFGVCPVCKNGFIVKRKASKGKMKGYFFGCSNYPNCNYISNSKIKLLKCPQCGSYMINDLENHKIKCIKCDFAIDLKT